ncbi:MAG: sensor histidine kinase [Gemmatimonadetes bacterium]|nr:sensor histidine kinase [Gemmatimonadota bacterium]
MPPVTVDGRLLALALGQLLENALRHVPPGTPVRAGVRDEDHGVALVVEDAGPGVPAEQLPQLFEPFFRQDLARTRGGAGLGLTLVRSVAQAHGGAVRADRSPLGGLRVRVVLPRTPAG